MKRNQRHSDDAKWKIGDAIRKALATPEARARMSASAKRQWIDYKKLSAVLGRSAALAHLFGAGKPSSDSKS